MPAFLENEISGEAHVKVGVNNRNKTFRLKIGRDNVVGLIDALIEPLTYVLVIFFLGLHETGLWTSPYVVVALVIFSVSFPGVSRLHERFGSMVFNIVLRWCFLSVMLLLFAFATQTLQLFSSEAIAVWLLLTPALLIVVESLFRALLPVLIEAQDGHVRSIVVGVNPQGLALAERLSARRDMFTDFLGFFDDRKISRIDGASVVGDREPNMLGAIADVPNFVRERRVQCIYLALPMTRQDRILGLLDALKDTTASIYFVPDIFVTDLIQGRVDMIGEMPVVAICETPFTGIDGLAKRLSDLLMASLILALISPLMVVIACAVKLSSPGSVIFRQRRYGLDGKEILIYKFRSMSVTEDGEKIVQATRNDSRVTPVGAFLRKTSLDELPQFINVLEGKMSIVGPRPHAVAHNELYRCLIKGYMVRHKVKPGITGWAQVNGYRGETETVEKMQKRIDYDLDYLRHWSLALDLKIILRTVGVVIKDQTAY
jgi:putative colanic acid biosynthesis UDP-glucose lipid carrier transferase